MRLKGANYVSSCKLSKNTFTCIITNEGNSDKIMVLCISKKGTNKIESSLKLLDLSFKYPSIYEKRKTVAHMILADSLLVEVQNVKQK